ncbi:hypothetical protein NG99_10565 [Erwinia typographi]|uniref:Sulfatase-modifying factor enzyme-like domain-containing protein n=1 Tax=Erwinia typographi TaxID=371042 RepID=A0A0A4A8A7_9GAMM|nr:SUMF1/EgtB/PvdO family nonheme iron enzyme [Erwinia typographi]KGT94083.1 hypothetical protein NG99_10565 [Erwinia typographi]
MTRMQNCLTGMLIMLALGGCRDEQKVKAEQDTLVNSSLDNMLTVKGGHFQMGDFGPLIGEKLPFSADRDNKPLHPIELSDFRIGKYRVTWGEFNRWLDIQRRNLSDFYEDARDSKYTWKSGREALGDSYPASASWNDARSYCLWLGQVSHRHIDLPTEAQWEYAARSRGQFLIFGNSDNWFHYENDEARNTAPSAENRPVGSYTPNPLGLYDMQGNGTDWIKDWYAADYYHHSLAKDPVGPAEGNKRVIRGTHHDAGGGYTITRGSMAPDKVLGPPSTSSGFRCAENNLPTKNE